MLGTTPIPNLIGGVSQQPAALRLATQCELQVNMEPSVVDGLGKRAPEEFIAKLLSSPLTLPYVHFISRDATEKYVVLIYDDEIKVFDLLTGDEKTVSAPNGKGYLNSSNPRRDFDVITIADYSFIVNKTVTTAKDAATTANRNHEAIVFVKAGNYDSNYKIKLYGKTVVYKFTYTATLEDIRTNKIATQMAQWLSDQMGRAWTASTAFTAELTTNNPSGAQRDANMAGRVVYNGSNYYICTQSGTSAASGGPTGTGTGIVDNTCLWDYLGPYDGAWTVNQQSSVIHLKRNSGADFVISSEDSQNNNSLIAFKNSVQRFSDLPTSAPNGYVVEVKGEVGSEDDNYFVEFEANSSTLSIDKGIWKEAVKQGIQYKFDLSTMPHTLVSNGDGTFTFDRGAWAEREVGDEDSNPWPSFTGQKINSVFEFLGRLGFLSQDAVILSQVGDGDDVFNFFHSTATALLDSAPIDLRANAKKVPTLWGAESADRRLIIFSDETQFILEAGDLLTPKSAQLKKASEFSATSDTNPVSVGTKIFFAIRKGDYTGLREYYVTENTSESMDAAEVTAHVPKYVPANPFGMFSSSNEDIVGILTEDEDNAIYLYKFFWQGNEKVLSSWHKWTFHSSATVLGASFIDTKLYVATQYADGVYLGVIDLAPGRVDSNHDYVTLLDRRVTEDDCSVAYDNGTNRTTYTLPYTIRGNPVIVTRSTGNDEVPGRVLTQFTPGSNTVIVAGNKTLTPVWIGEEYESRYRFSEQTVKREAAGGGVVALGNIRIQNAFLHLRYANTGFFKVEVTPRYRDMRTYTFTGRIIGSGNNTLASPSIETGVFRVPIRSKSDRVTVDLVSTSFLPCRFLSAEWESQVTSRAQSI